MASPLDIEIFLKTAAEIPVVDVRSEGEFQRGHIPGAFNIPLFNNAERALVGTTYKKTGKEEAVEEGLEIVGPKLIAFVKEAKLLAKDKQVLVHCWRGGMRSESFAWLLRTSGLQATCLKRGYKAYRNHVLSFFSTPFKLMLLGGKTGSGKTRILRQLQDKGQQVVDLEALCNHKGSTFGAIGQEAQPTTEQFENNLYEVLKHFDPQKPIWLESESKCIGRIYIPDPFWDQMKTAPLTFVEIDKNIRIKNLVKEYASFPKELLAQAIERIQTKLGGLNFKLAMLALENNDFEQVADLCLLYYDKAYLLGLNARDKNKIISIDAKNIEETNLADLILTHANTFYS